VERALWRSVDQVGGLDPITAPIPSGNRTFAGTMGPPWDILDPVRQRRKRPPTFPWCQKVGGPFHSPLSRSLSENNVCALKVGEIGKVYGRKTLAIPPILSIQMLFSDRLLENAEFGTGNREGEMTNGRWQMADGR